MPQSDQVSPTGTSCFLRPVCKTCNHLNPTISISDPKCKFEIKHSFTCVSSNLIYCISCCKCGKLYIGGTGRRLGDRFAEYLRDIKNNECNKPVARHFNSASHSISDIKVSAILSITGANDTRKKQEQRLIYKLGTFHPHGLDERFSLI